jgi:hypothetical protein
MGLLLVALSSHELAAADRRFAFRKAAILRLELASGISWDESARIGLSMRRACAGPTDESIVGVTAFRPRTHVHIGRRL